jgi:hypothetical protein
MDLRGHPTDDPLIDEEWRRGMRDFMVWLSSDLRAFELLKQHGVEMMAHDLIVWAGYQPPQKLRERYLLGVAARLATEQVFGEVLSKLQSAGVNLVVQKGFWLATNVYPVACWRQYADLDLLIHDADIQKVDTTLRELKFTPIFSALPGRKTIPAWVDHHVLDSLEYKRDVYCVDVHLNLVPHVLPNRYNMAEGWKEAHPEALFLNLQASQDNKTVITAELLHPYDTVMHILLHSGYHCMENGFRGLLDVLLVRRYFLEGGGWDGKWEWPEFLKRAKHWKVDYLIAGPLMLMRQLMLPEEQLLPGSAATQLDLHGKVLARHRHLAFIEQFIVEPRLLAVNARDFFNPLIGAGFGRWVRALLHYCFPSLRRMAARYHMEPNDTRLFLLYFIRPFDLLGRYMPSVIRRLLAAI